MSRLCISLFDTAANPKDIEVIFYIDNDDIKSSSKAKELKEKHNIQYIVGERIVLSQMWNECWKLAKGEYLFHCGDDIIMRTENWDKIVLSKFDEYEDKILFVHGSDGHHGVKPGTTDAFGTHAFIHKNWAETVGYFVPPYFSSDYNDTWLNDVSASLQRRFKVDIFTEHMHPAAEKSVWDKTHLERMERGAADNVDEMYHSQKMQYLRSQDSQKLQNFIDSYEC